MSELEKIVEAENPQPPEVVSDPKPAEEEQVVLTKAEHEALLKAKQVGETYKQENEKYRKSDRKVEAKVSSEITATPEQTVLIQNDYLSKREDVYEEFADEFKTLEETEWSKIKPLITPALDSIYYDSAQALKFVPTGKLQKAIKELIDYAKADRSKKVELDKAKKDTAIEMNKYEAAEITSVKTSKKAPAIQVTEDDKERSKQSGLPPEKFAEIRVAREKRLEQFNKDFPTRDY